MVMRPPKALVSVIIILLGLLSTKSLAQIDCQVTVNTDKINTVAPDQLRSFGSDIQNYINTNKWTKEDLGDYKIKCTISIFFVGVPGDNTYSAQMFIGSERPIYVGDKPSEKSTAVLRLFDDQWQFTYIKSQPLYRDESRFDPLTSFIDFYMNLVVGYDFDSYDAMTGTPYFQKALTICNLAPGSAVGWGLNTSQYNRMAFVQELLNSKYFPFRQGMYTYYFKGLDLLATKPDDARKNIIGFVQQTGDLKRDVNPRSLIIKAFFDTNYLELADIFKNYQDNSVIQLLCNVDPAHAIVYSGANSQ
jgi:Domain of unknown function (DUF4835)